MIAEKSSEITEVSFNKLFFLNCAFFVAWGDKSASVMSRPPFWCSRLKCVFVQFHWDDKRPPAAHKLLLLKGVARIRTSEKTKSSLYCFLAAAELGCYVQLLVHVVKLRSLNVHVCRHLSVHVQTFSRPTLSFSCLEIAEVSITASTS